MVNRQSQAVDETHEPPEQLEGLIDLNLLPARYQRQRPSVLTILAWLLVVALLGLLLPSASRFQEATAELRQQRAELAAAEERLVSDAARPAQLESLQAEIERAQEQAEDLQRALDRVNIQIVTWGANLTDAVEAAPEGVQIETLQENTGEVHVVGLAANYADPLAYAQALEQLEAYQGVVLESITRVEFETGEDPFPDQPALEEAEPTPDASPTPTDEAEGEPTIVAYAFQLRAPLVGADLTPEAPESEEVSP